jgi:ankyrin repeat protein
MIRTCMTILLVSATTLLFAGKPKPDKDLYEGITKGNIEVVKKAIGDGADVNKKYSMKLPILWALESSHQVAIIQLLIDKGADVNASDINGSVLTQYGQRVETPANKAQWLMDFYKKYKVDTVIDPAIYSSITDVVNVLLNAGAKPNYDMGTILGTPIQGAIAFGIGSEEARAEFVKAMISHPTNPADANDRMRTTESVASSSQGFKMVDKEKHPTPLMYAIQKGYTKIALALIEGGADVNITMNVYKSKSDMWAVYNTQQTVTALDIARQRKNTEVENKLIEKGAK